MPISVDPPGQAPPERQGRHPRHTRNGRRRGIARRQRHTTAPEPRSGRRKPPVLENGDGDDPRSRSDLGTFCQIAVACRASLRGYANLAISTLRTTFFEGIAKSNHRIRLRPGQYLSARPVFILLASYRKLWVFFQKRDVNLDKSERNGMKITDMARKIIRSAGMPPNKLS